MNSRTGQLTAVQRAVSSDDADFECSISARDPHAASALSDTSTAVRAGRFSPQLHRCEYISTLPLRGRRRQTSAAGFPCFARASESALAAILLYRRCALISVIGRRLPSQPRME